MPTITMRCPAEEPGATLAEVLPFYRPDPDTPACGETAYVPADATTDHTERLFICDRPEGHDPADRHRHVTDPAAGRATEWTATPGGQR